METTRKARIESIDLLRGVVIILMALDHVRMYFGEGGFYAETTDLDTTTPVLFFTRWITHFCAPVFIFLAGTSVCLYRARLGTNGLLGKREISSYALKRGIWLVFLELVVVNFAWTFDPTFSFHFLQVIWAIGISMIVLAGLVYLPKWAIFTFGIVLVLGHNLLDPIQMEDAGAKAILWYILHQNQLVVFAPNSAVYFHYPLIPLVGLMALGYVFGALYEAGFDPERRRKWLNGMGGAAILPFLILRGFNLYGEPAPWSQQSTAIYTIMSFLNTTKYPASLQYLLMTMGPALVFLALTEAVKNRISDTVLVFGRVSLFFYIVHIYLIHVLALAGLVIAGRSWTDWVITAEAFLNATPSDAGFPLSVVYAVWVLVLAAMYPLSRWYQGYKKAHPERWLLRYV